MSRLADRLMGILLAAVTVYLGPQAGAADLATQLAGLDSRVVPADSDLAKRLPTLLARDARRRRDAANVHQTRAWRQVRTRADWERFRDARLRALRDSLGSFPPPPTDLHIQVTGRLEGNDYRIEKLVFESRLGLRVTAHLYLPAHASRPGPGILLVHSHHNPKTQGELQDMGMTWARLGCVVLVMDQLGHGERRQHPFRTAHDFPHPFRVGRQDYYFRYNEGIQLHLIGDSLIGWMVWDIQRGVDLLRARTDVDGGRIVVVGAVAGGGDPAAVAAALDPRVAAVVPFNFGGPQPETRYPLPAEAEETFNFAGGGSWESTRNLRHSARDGFLPWVIVGSVAPRPLIYGHEFAWDQTHDPVWARLQKIYGFYAARDHLASVHGRGSVTGQPPASTHCNNIGPEHRKGIYPALERWFHLPVPTAEYQQRHKPEDLACLSSAAPALRPLYELAGDLGAQRIRLARKRLAALTPAARRQRLRRDWTQLLGDSDSRSPQQASDVVPLLFRPEKPRGEMTVRVFSREPIYLGEVTGERVLLQVDREVFVPLLLLVPARREGARLPVVVAVAQAGKEAFLKQRAEMVAALLRGGAAVCLPDLRGTGETRPADDSRGRQSSSTALSSTELMMGRTLLGLRLHDLRQVLAYLGSRPDLDGGRIGLWGDSFTAPNPPDRNVRVPLDAEPLPRPSEPLGGLLALLGALYEADVRAVYARGGLVGYQSLLASPFCYLPHDCVVPGALTAGDLSDVAAALAPRPVRLEGLVDGLNCRVAPDRVAEAFAPARAAYRSLQAGSRLRLEGEEKASASAGRWLLSQLRTD